MQQEQTGSTSSTSSPSTATCVVHGLQSNGLQVTYGYSDGELFTTVLADVTTPQAQQDLELRLRAEVRGPNHEEDALHITYAEPLGTFTTPLLPRAGG